MKSIKGTMFLNDKPIGTFTNFKLNLKETKMKRKHVIEEQALKIEELEDELECWIKRTKKLNIQLDLNETRCKKLQNLSQSAVNFISIITGNININ